MNTKVEDYFPFSIKKVRLIHLTINENLYIDSDNQKVTIEMAQSTGIDVKNDLLYFTLYIYIHYEGSPIPGGIIADIKVENVFHVPSIERLKNEKGAFLPDVVLIPVISMAISHTRALFCQALAGTVYDGVIIPITNPIDAANYLFPKKERKEDVETKSKTAKKKATK